MEDSASLPSAEDAAGGVAPGIAEADLRLARSVCGKDRKATAEFVEAHADAVYQFVSHRLSPNQQEADDMVQDVFLAALQRLESYRGRGSLRGWILGIARNKLSDYYRSRLRSAPLEDEAPDSAVEVLEVSSPLDEETLRQATLTALKSLREDYRVLLQWRYWDGKSTAEMAQLLGRTEKSVERALARARRQFKLAWEARGDH